MPHLGSWIYVKEGNIRAILLCLDLKKLDIANRVGTRHFHLENTSNNTTI
jgi:hypothetical protein